MKELERIFSKINKTDTCWNWTASKNKGYGQVGYKGRVRRVHRLIYELLVGEIPKGMTLDHLCRNRACVNPNHLEITTNRENILRGIGLAAINYRKTHCIHGHEFTKQNTYWKNGRGSFKRRVCRECQRIE